MAFSARFLQALQGHLVFRNIHAGFFLEFLHQPVDHPLVDVVAAEVRVAVGGFHFHYAVAYFENRNVERAAAEIVHGDGFVGLLVQAVSERRRRRLIDDAHHFKTRNLSGVFGGLALRVVEVRRHRNDRLGDFLAQVGFGRFFQFPQNHCGDLGWRIPFPHDLDARVAVLAGDNLIGNQLHFLGDFIEPAAHEALNRINCVLRIRDGLPFRYRANQPLTTLGESDYRRSGPSAFLVGDNNRLPTLHHGHDRIGRSQVYPNDFTHLSSIPRSHIPDALI